MGSELSARVPKPHNKELDPDKPPFAPWSTSHTFYQSNEENQYDPGYTLLALYTWDDDVPECMSSAIGLRRQDVAHMAVTFARLDTGEVVDVHDHYFAGGAALEKLGLAFKRQVVPLWKLARRYSDEFPSYTLIDMNGLLDPFVDNQPKYFWPSDYAEIAESELASSIAKVILRGETPKRNTRTHIEVFYSDEGRVNGCNCLVERRSTRYRLRIRSTKEGLYVKRVDKMPPRRFKWINLFEVTGYKEWKRPQRFQGK